MNDVRVIGLDQAKQVFQVQARENETAYRLMTVHEMVLLTAIASVALAPPLQTLQRRHNSAARLRLMPRRHLTGGEQPPGATMRGVRLLQRRLIS